MQEKNESANVRNAADSDEDLEEAVAAEPEHPLDIKRLRTDTSPDTRRLYIILEHAPLEAIKVFLTISLLSIFFLNFHNFFIYFKIKMFLSL